MRRLVIDCATEACSVALFEQGRLVAGTFEMLGRGHAERLVPMIGELPGSGQAEEIAVDLGPGSFTGIRVGLAAAKALALAWGATLIGYRSTALVAAMARAERGPVALDVAMTGGHGDWFLEGFSPGARSHGELRSLSPADAAACSAAALVAGSQAEALVARRESGIALPLWPDARRADLLPQWALSEPLAPVYGRAPDARLPAVQ